MKLHLKKISFLLIFACSLIFAQEDNSVAADNAAEPVDANVFIEDKPAAEKIEIVAGNENMKTEEASENIGTENSGAVNLKNEEALSEEKENNGNAPEKTVLENTGSLIPAEQLAAEIPAQEVPGLIELFGDRPEVEHWRQLYLSEKWQKVLRNILENAVEYRIYVRKCVAERQVPLELEYLPVVESGYKTAVRSKSGAIGMWQFMSNSVRPFLKLNEYVDERYDPWLSTQAGISKLQDNYKLYNDWLIAIAAYNCGNGKMHKIIKTAGTGDYWQLVEKNALPKQTAEYIPKLIAIADLAVNHEKYGIDLPSHDEEYEELLNKKDEAFDYVTIKKPYLISVIAKGSGISEKELKHLNPALTKGFTPPAASYELRLPAGKKEAVETALTKIKPIEFPFQYTVVKGDSLWSISRKFGVTVQALCDTNGIKENAILKIGKVLYVPSVKVKK